MEQVSTHFLFFFLFFLLILSGFFSSSETGMMAINRYRLKHLVREGHKGAIRVDRLLLRPDRLIGVILIGNNFVNILASALATVIATRLWGDSGIAIATFGLTCFLLVFGEVTPKTIAAIYPERVAFPASLVLYPLLKLLYPLVVALNWLCSFLLKPMGITSNQSNSDQLNADELRTLVHESGLLIPQKRRGMLLSILDLEKVNIDDIMVPRNEVIGIDMDDDIKSIISQLYSCQHTRLVIYQGDINNIIGILHLRKVARLLSQKELDKSMLKAEISDPYFILESTPLHTQLYNFQKTRQRVGLVVDEYGDLLGLVTLDDILEEIVGEFTTDVYDSSHDIIPQSENSYIIDGSTSLRTINRQLNWTLPIDKARTLNGLIAEEMESIPHASLCLQVQQYKFEILSIKDNCVKSVKAWY